MSFSLFQLVPSVYKLRDAQVASTMQLLTAAEQAQLASLQAMTPPLPADSQAQLDALTAKATRGPLQSLLMVIDEQLAAFAEDLDQLYDDQFIETCAPWVIPYIGDLIGYQSIQGISAAVDNPRSEVANTIALRRRKGTVLVLEQLARDITGWGAHAVEFFQVLADTQYMKHVRLWNFYSPDVRGWQPRFYRNSGFSRMTHKVDVRNPATPGLPRYDIQNIGIFLWSLGAYSVTEGTPTPCSTNSPGAAICYRLSSLGMDMPLFHAAVSQGATITAAATPANVPDWLPRLVLCADLQKGVGTQYYGQGASLALYFNNQLLNPYQIQVANLSGADGSWNNLPPANSPYSALVDPDLGRIALPSSVGTAAPSSPIMGRVTSGAFTANEGVTQSSTGATATLNGTVPECGPMAMGPITGNADAVETWVGNTSGAVFTPTPLQVSYFYGFNAAMGGGEYERGDGFTVTDEAWIFPYPDTATPPRYTNLQSALNYVVSQLGVEGQVALEITSSQTYTVTTGELTIDLPAGTTVEFRAQDGCRPTILLDGELSVAGDENSQFLMNGLLVGAGASMTPATSSALVHVPANRPSGSANLLSELNLTHCTLVPGWSVGTTGEPQYPTATALIAEPSGVEIIAQYSILGAIRAANLLTVNASNSIVDATDRRGVAYAALDGASGGGALTLTGCTVVGMVHAQVLSLVSDCIFWGPALAQGAPCRPFTFSVAPFASVYYITPPNAAGDMLVVGTPNPSDPTIQQLLMTIPLPNAPNQQICGPVELAPGLEVNAYVPTAAERNGDFSAFAAVLTDPSPGSPFPITGGIIPPERWGEVFAWRISPVPSSQWVAPLWADRKQEGCVRFSFLPPGAQTPRRFKCVEQELASAQPIFFSLRYGNPGYLKMLACTDPSIRRGADDGGEMGAFHFVLAPQRESDLTVRLQEYLPVGLSAGLIYQT